MRTCASSAPPALHLPLVRIHNHTEDPLSCDNAIGRIVKIPVRSDHCDTKIANLIFVRHRTRIRQDNKWHIGARDQPALPGKCDKEQSILDRELPIPPRYFLYLAYERLLSRAGGKDQDHRLASQVPQSPDLAGDAAPRKVRRGPRNRVRRRILGFSPTLCIRCRHDQSKEQRAKNNNEWLHTFMISTSLEWR